MKTTKIGENKCKWLRFRAFSKMFFHEGRFQETRGFRLLKRQSCTGCKECGYTWDFIKEVLADYDEIPIKDNLPIDIYKDYTISIDGEDMEFYPLEDQKFK